MAQRQWDASFALDSLGLSFSLAVLCSDLEPDYVGSNPGSVTLEMCESGQLCLSVLTYKMGVRLILSTQSY
jgi:hypothetical protein